MGRTIEIAYWKLTKLPGLEWEGKEEIKSVTKKEYRRKLYRILSRIEDAGYNAMVLHHKNIFVTTVFIDEGRFKQS